jgi:hypothetical protein
MKQASTLKKSGSGVGKFAQSTDNSDIVGKQMIRQWCMDLFGGAANCRVLELFGGLGHVYDHCYADPPVEAHMAFELRKVDRPTWMVGNNEVLLPKYVNQGWDLYDLDAYSNPWVLAKNICKLRNPGQFTFAVTDGIIRGLNTGTTNGYVRQACGYNGMPDCGLLTRFYPEIVQSLVNDWRQYGVEVLQGVRTKSVGSHLVTYYGFALEKS